MCVCVQTEAKDKEMIVSLLDLRKRMVDIVEQSFGGSRSFRDGIKEAFDSFINSRQNKPAEMLAKCCALPFTQRVFVTL